jgi:hypothetical protein
MKSAESFLADIFKSAPLEQMALLSRDVELVRHEILWLASQYSQLPERGDKVDELLGLSLTVIGEPGIASSDRWILRCAASSLVVALCTYQYLADITAFRRGLIEIGCCAATWTDCHASFGRHLPSFVYHLLERARGHRSLLDRNILSDLAKMYIAIPLLQSQNSDAASYLRHASAMKLEVGLDFRIVDILPSIDLS